MKKNHFKKIHSSGFTLVELIVVITILAILGVFSIIQFSSFQSSARDSDRITTFKNIGNGLEVMKIRQGTYPIPDGVISTGSINGIVYSNMGVIGDTISRNSKMSKAPIDPLSRVYYIYAISTDQKMYQIAITLENPTTYILSPATPVYAASPYVAKVSGNYPGYLKFNSGSEVWIANIPSLIWNNTGSVNLFSTGTRFVVDRFSNLPYVFQSGSDIGSQNADEIIRLMRNNSNVTLTGVNITSITTQTGVSQIFTGTLLQGFGGNVSEIQKFILGTSAPSAPSLVNGACTGLPTNALYYSSSTGYTLVDAPSGTSLMASYTGGTIPIKTCMFNCNSTYEWSGVACLKSGSDQTVPGLSCKDILNKGGNTGSGIYWIKPDSNPSFQVYCDMSTAGGGWTRLAKSAPSYGHSSWTDSNGYGTVNSTSYISKAFFTLTSFTEVFFWNGTAQGGNVSSCWTSQSMYQQISKSPFSCSTTSIAGITQTPSISFNPSQTYNSCGLNARISHSFTTWDSGVSGAYQGVGMNGYKTNNTSNCASQCVIYTVASCLPTSYDGTAGNSSDMYVR